MIDDQRIIWNQIEVSKISREHNKTMKLDLKMITGKVLASHMTASFPTRES
jgi:hypothetical protein